MKVPNAWPNGKPPERVLAFVDWLLTPEPERVPSTRIAYSKQVGVSMETLRTWEKDDRVRWVIQEKADKLNMSPERVQAVMNALYKKAQAGDVQAAKLYMEHVDKIMPRKQASGNDLRDLSDEELAELAAGLAG